MACTSTVVLTAVDGVSPDSMLTVSAAQPAVAIATEAPTAGANRQATALAWPAANACPAAVLLLAMVLVNARA